MVLICGKGQENSSLASCRLYHQIPPKITTVSYILAHKVRHVVHYQAFNAKNDFPHQINASKTTNILSPGNLLQKCDRSKFNTKINTKKNSNFMLSKITNILSSSIYSKSAIDPNSILKPRRKLAKFQYQMLPETTNIPP